MVISILVFIAGCIIGSFINVVVCRLQAGEQFVHGRSKCPRCEARLAWHENIPLFSFLALRGKCRHCHKPVSLQYPLVEFGFGLLLVGFYLHFGLSMSFAAWSVIGGFLTAIFVYDIRFMEIPDVLSLPAAVIALFFNLIIGFSILSLLIGAVIGGSFFAAQYFLSKGKWIGDGDIRLGIVMGAALGWQLLLVALFVSYVVGSVVGLSLIALRKKDLTSTIPFGPFLVTGTFVALFWGVPLMKWYLNFTI